MGSKLVALGDFSFKYRGYMLPVAVLLLLTPSEPITGDPAHAGLIGFLMALVGQAARITTTGTYEDRWVRTPEGWRIAERSLYRDSMEGAG